LSLNYNKEVEYIELDEVRKKIPDFAQCDRTAGIIERFFITDFQFDVKKFKDIIRLTDVYSRRYQFSL
jgi:hypothetical protein